MAIATPRCRLLPQPQPFYALTQPLQPPTGIAPKARQSATKLIHPRGRAATLLSHQKLSSVAEKLSDQPSFLPSVHLRDTPGASALGRDNLPALENNPL